MDFGRLDFNLDRIIFATSISYKELSCKEKYLSKYCQNEVVELAIKQ